MPNQKLFQNVANWKNQETDIAFFITLLLSMGSQHFHLASRASFDQVSADMIFVKTFTLEDFGPIIFYSKVRNSRHIKFCDKTA